MVGRSVDRLCWEISCLLLRHLMRGWVTLWRAMCHCCSNQYNSGGFLSGTDLGNQAKGLEGDSR